MQQAVLVQEVPSKIRSEKTLHLQFFRCKIERFDGKGEIENRSRMIYTTLFLHSSKKKQIERKEIPHLQHVDSTKLCLTLIVMVIVMDVDTPLLFPSWLLLVGAWLMMDRRHSQRQGLSNLPQRESFNLSSVCAVLSIQNFAFLLCPFKRL